MRKTALLLTGLILLLAGCEHSVEITVICRNEIGQPIEGVVLSLNDQLTGTSSREGVVTTEIPRPGDGRLHLSAEREGFYPLERDVTVPSDAKARFSILLTERRILEIRTVLLEDEVEAALPEVTIRLNGQDLGITDAEGVLSHEFQAKIGEDLEIDAFAEGFSPLELLPIWVPVKVGRIRFLEEIRFEPQVERVETTIRLDVLDPIRGGPIPDVQVFQEDEALGSTDLKGQAEIVLKAPVGARIDLELQRPGFLFTPDEKKLVMREGAIHRWKAHGTDSGVVPPPPIHDPPVYRVATKVDFLIEPDAPVDQRRWRTVIEKDLAGFYQEAPYLRAASLGRVDPVAGWEPSQASLDYCTLVVVRAGEENSLEMQLLSPHGQPRIRKVFEGFASEDLRYILSEVVRQLQVAFPVEGIVKSARQGEIQVNIGQDRNLAEGDVLVDRRNTVTAQVLQVDARTARAHLKRGSVRLNSRLMRRTSLPDPGQRVVLDLVIREAEEPPLPLSGVNVYVDGQFSGQTDSGGQLSLLAPQGRPYELELALLGYTRRKETLIHQRGESRELSLTQEFCRLQITSLPSSSQVFLGENQVGTTPLDARFAIGFYRLKLVPSDTARFRTWISNQKIALMRSGLERTVVHTGDFLGKGGELESRGEQAEALRMYSQVPVPTDKLQIDDYVEAQFAIGRINLEQTGRFERAVLAFSRVVELDERYALAHLNLGLALHKAKRYQESVRRMEIARRYERYLPRAVYSRAVADIHFTWALSLHRMGQASGDPDRRERLIQEACHRWQEFFDRTAETATEPHVQELRGLAAAHRQRLCQGGTPGS